ncbi:MAG TPA: hypothetical protein VHS96_08665 [Bacteroidia bacterium]|nr:hypothetical protein [Bacteroidia bacterium]
MSSNELQSESYFLALEKHVLIIVSAGFANLRGLCVSIDAGKRKCRGTGAGRNGSQMAQSQSKPQQHQTGQSRSQPIHYLLFIWERKKQKSQSQCKPQQHQTAKTAATQPLFIINYAYISGLDTKAPEIQWLERTFGMGRIPSS